MHSCCGVQYVALYDYTEDKFQGIGEGDPGIYKSSSRPDPKSGHLSLKVLIPVQRGIGLVPAFLSQTHHPFILIDLLGLFNKYITSPGIQPPPWNFFQSYRD